MAVKEPEEEPQEEPQAAKAAKKGKKAGPRGERLAKLQKAAEEDSAEEEPAGEEEEKPKRRKSKAKRLQEDEESEEEEERGVVKLKQLPKGMAEPEMMEYFTQFGQVTRLRVARSKRTLASKGYGWVEFKQREVADIVAKTMDKYMLWGQVLEATLLPPEEVHRHLFARHWQVERPQKPPIRVNREKAIFLLNERPKTVEEDGEFIAQRTFLQARKQHENLKKLKEKLERVGVDYDLGPFLAMEEGNEEFEAAMAEFDEEQKARRQAAEEAEAAREAKREERKKKKEAAEKAAAEEEGAGDAEDAPAEEEAAVEEAAPAKKRKAKKREVEAEEAEAAEAAPAKASKKRRKAA